MAITKLDVGVHTEVQMLSQDIVSKVTDYLDAKVAELDAQLKFNVSPSGPSNGIRLPSLYTCCLMPLAFDPRSLMSASVFPGLRFGFKA